MHMRIPHAAAALLTAGVLIVGAAAAASAHQLSGATRGLEDEAASAPRVEQPELSPEPDDDMTAPVVVTAPAPEPSESPEANEPAEAPEPPDNENEMENENEAPRTVVTNPTQNREAEGDHHEGGHDD